MIKNTIKQRELNPDVLVKLLLPRKKELEEILSVKELLIKKAPEGELRLVKRGNSIQYHHKHPHSVPDGDYLKRNQDSLAAALAQKNYDNKLIRELKTEIKALDRFLIDYRPDRIDEIYTNLHDCRKPLIRPAMLPDKDYVKRWIGVEYQKKEFEENVPDYFTANGERVRSKSEILIADALRRHKIPYRYEFPMHIPGYGMVHPDFTCLNVRERKEYIWEHNGMMSDSKYADYAIKRIEMYTLVGYSPRDNLILSFESASHPLNSRIIESNIIKYLL